MKILIVYYSHTGNNKILATETAKNLGAEIIEIEEIGSRSNTKISRELVRRLGKNQAFLLDFNMIHFLSAEQNKDAKAISNIFLEEDSGLVKSLSSAITETVKAMK